MVSNIDITSDDKQIARGRAQPSTAFCVALGGVTSALVLLMMFCATIFPMLNIAIPTYAGFLMVVIVVEAGTKWAVTAYFACAALSLLTTPDYEATLLFILFMGYYPIIFTRLELLKKRVKTAAKFAIFNTAMVVYALFFRYIFTSVDIFEGMESFGKYAPIALLALANAFFVVYDNLLERLIMLYTEWFRRKILKRK